MSNPDGSAVCIVYTADPLGDTTGGIDSIIRGVLQYAPPDIRMSVVGVTTDRQQRPVRRWTACSIAGRAFDFYPVVGIRNSTSQARIPVTLRFLAALGLRRPAINADVLEFHRIEPCLAFLKDPRPKTLVMHQNMEVIRNAESDIRWKHWPGLYFGLEDRLLPKFESVYCVREDAAKAYRDRYPELADRFSFTPTWVDTRLFSEPGVEQRRQQHRGIREEFGFSEDSFVLVTVGRLDKQKNPLRLLEAFRLLQERMPDARLVYVGEGVLRAPLEDKVKQLGLGPAVKLAGAKPPAQVSRYLQGADMFVLSSDYEGMPICVLEALASGLPVASTAVGEVPRVVKPGANGELAGELTADALASAIGRCRDRLESYVGAPAVASIREFTPATVLSPIYDNYRKLAGRAHRQTQGSAR